MGTALGNNAHVRAAPSEREVRKIAAGKNKRTKAKKDLLVSDEAADRNASPAHAAHQAASHHAASKGLAPWATAGVSAIGILDVHGDGFRADERVLTTAAQGRVEGTGCHGRRGVSVGFGFGVLNRDAAVIVVEAVVADNVVKGEVGKVDVTVTKSYHPCAT